MANNELANKIIEYKDKLEQAKIKKAELEGSLKTLPEFKIQFCNYSCQVKEETSRKKIQPEEKRCPKAFKHMDALEAGVRVNEDEKADDGEQGRMVGRQGPGIRRKHGPPG